MALLKQIQAVANSDSKQITRVPNKSPNTPFIAISNIDIELNGKKEKVDLNITLPIELLRDIERESIRELKALQESAEVKVG